MPGSWIATRPPARPPSARRSVRRRSGSGVRRVRERRRRRRRGVRPGRLVPGVCPASIHRRRRRRRRRSPPGWDVAARVALHALGSSSRVAARVIVSHPGDACAALARVLLVGDDESRAAAAAAAAALAENVGSGGGYRATMVAVPGLVSGLAVRAGRVIQRGRDVRGGGDRAFGWGRIGGGRWGGGGVGFGRRAGGGARADEGVGRSRSRRGRQLRGDVRRGVAATASVRGGRGERGAGAAHQCVDDAGVNRV